MAEDLLKIVLVGDAEVGKTHLLSRYMKGELPRAPAATIGVEFATRTVELPVGAKVKVQIWDTAGQERYRAITKAHYRKAAGALLVYDITQRDSYSNCSTWLEELRQSAGTDTVVMLVGNKVDLAERDPSARKVAFDEAEKFAHQAGCLFAESSAVTAYGVNEIFESLLQEVYTRSARRGAVGDRVSSGIQTLSDGAMRAQQGCCKAS